MCTSMWGMLIAGRCQRCVSVSLVLDLMLTVSRQIAFCSRLIEELKPAAMVCRAIRT